MDSDFQRPSYRASAARPLAPAFAGAGHAADVAISAGAQTITATTSATAHQEFVSTEPKHIDFISGARNYKKRILHQSLMRGFAMSVYVLAGFALLLAAGGVFINQKYSGRALPFTHIGDVAVGGLNEQQIKSALDSRVQNMQIKFVDGGLVRYVPLSQFAIKVDTAAVAHEATHSRFNPFAFLNERRFEANVAVNERQVDGYVASVINSSKTESENATLAVVKGKVQIVPETQGFRTDPQFVFNSINVALKNLAKPVVNVNMVTLKPSVYSTDLEDDLARANALLNNTVALEYGHTIIKPSAKDKASWLQISQVPGSTDVNLSFSSSLIRQYVISQANRFQPSSNVGNTAAADAAVATTQRGTVIDNIDESANALVDALDNGKALTQVLTSKIGTYNKLVTSNQNN